MVSGIACLVVFVSTYALILPAITMEKTAECGIEAHQHSDECYSYELICSLPESDGHIHDDSCYTTHDELSCQLEEHIHDDSCYDEDGNLICEQPAHEHDSGCWQQVTELTCGLEESEGHRHTDACYEKVLTCGYEEHIHSDACYSKGEQEAAGTAATGAQGVLLEGDAADRTDSSGENAAGGITADPAEIGLTAETAAEPDTYVPSLDALDFDRILSRDTGVYYYHTDTPQEAGEIRSADIPADAWQKVERETVLGENDILRVYFSYTIPGGSLNETNETARYRLPAALHISDEQIESINRTENGIAAACVDYDTLTITDPDSYDKYLGVEAVEGSRRPGELPADDAQEFISAVVRVENIYDTEGLYGEKDAFLGQDLVFTFVPYTIQKNRNTYDGQGNPTSAGETVRGWFFLDFTPGQVELGEPYTEESEKSTPSGDAGAAGEEGSAESGEILETIIREYRTAEIVFVEEDRARNLDEISTVIRILTSETIVSAGEEPDETLQAEDTEETLAAEDTENTEATENTEETPGTGDEETIEDKEGAETADDAAEKDGDLSEDGPEGLTGQKGAEDSSDGKTADEQEDARKEDQKALEPQDPVMPAMSFEDSIRVHTGKPAGVEDGSAGSAAASAAEALPEKTRVTVRVEADEGTFPAGTTMILSAVEDMDAVAETVRDVVDNQADAGHSADSAGPVSSGNEGSSAGENTSGTGANHHKKTYGFQAVDISFRDADGNEIEPAKPVRVALTSEIAEQVRKEKETDQNTALADPVVVHMGDDGNVEKMNLIAPDEIRPAQGKSEEELLEEREKAAAEAAADAAKKSAEETAEEAVEETAEAAEVDTGQVGTEAAEAGEAAAGQAGKEAAEATEEAAGQTGAAAKGNTEDADRKTGTERENDIDRPAGKDGPEQVKEGAETGTTGEEAVFFETDSFSVYAIVYTVDFHYEVNGRTYEFSIPGGGFISLEHLVEALGLTDSAANGEQAEEAGDSAGTEEAAGGPGAYEESIRLNSLPVSEATKEFVADVEMVEFSSPQLVWTGRADTGTTVGQLKEGNGLDCRYSAQLTEEQIAEINAQTVEAGDWALISMLPFDTAETLTVTMKNGDTFTIFVTDAQDPLGLDGMSYALLTKKNGTAGHALMAGVHTQIDTRGYYLSSINVNLNDETQYALVNGDEYIRKDADLWTFEYNAEQQAYYVSSGGKYLYIDPAVASKTGTSEHSLNLVSEKNTADGGTLIRITRDEDGNYYLGNVKGTLVWDYSGTNTSAYWLSNPDASDESGTKEDNAAFRLCIPENPYGSHKATLISASDMQEGQRLVIYQRVLQDDNTFLYYAVNGDGNLVRVYPSGDSVYWIGDQSVEWTLEDLGSGYYRLKNTSTGTYLTPKGGTTPTTVHAENAFANTNELSVSLPGKDGGTYTSKISCWDYTNHVTEGLLVTSEGSTVTLSAEPLTTSQEFYFASRDPIVEGQLSTVETVDSEKKGIKITMYDFKGEISNARMTYHNYAMGGDSWAEGVLNQGIMGRTLYRTDNTVTVNGKTQKGEWVNGTLMLDGFPNSEKTGRSYGLVFQDGSASGTNWYQIGSEKEANNLFLKSVYDSTGYFHYSSFENFARFNETTGDFTVYEQLGTPACLNDDWNAAYMNRGNFMPYNDLNPATSKTHTPEGTSTQVTGNWYQSSNSDPLPDDDPRKGERLYQLEGVTDHSNTSYNKLDYFFGMIMEAKFMQGADGLNDRGDPIRYEFNGDDDLYIYADGVLLMDIGGVHDAFQGYIDFKTGLIEVLPATKESANMFRGSQTTIKRQYWEAGKFPDGTDWNHSQYPYDSDKANQYFDGETYRDYTTHEFKMFYMERGAGASNLEMQFNLITLTDSQFRVKKEMPETQTGQTIQNEYADAVFYYEAYVKEQGDTQFKPVTRAYLSQLKSSNKIEDDTLTYDDGTQVIWKSTAATETKFELKPGQTAIFPAADDSVEWYVVEVEPESNSQMLSSYEVTNDDQDPAHVDGRWSNVKRISDRNQVVFQNRPSDDLVNELRITKKINGTPYNKAGVEDRFEYRIFLEATSGELVPYREGEYYQLDKDGKYVYFENGERRTQDEPRVAERASTNGSISNILDGDSIIIKGLLEGTDFYVYERTRTDYNNMAPDGNLVEDKYVFEGTDLTGAFDRRIHDPATYSFGHIVGHMFDEPSGLADEEDRQGLITRYSISQYEQDKAVWGSILMGSDADILVKNRPCHPLPIELKKNWPTEDFTMDDLKDSSSVTFTIQRYKLDTRHGTVNLTGVLQNPPHTGADPVYHFVKDGRTIKSVAYTDLEDGNLDVTDLPIGTYTIVCDEYVVGYDITEAYSPSATITVNEGETTNVTVTTAYTRQTGSLTIRKTVTGDLASHAGDTFTYKVYGPDGFYYEETTPAVSQAVNGVLTIQVPTEANSSNYALNTGAYIISETVNRGTASDGSGRLGTHVPTVQAVSVVKNDTVYADFTGDYAARLVPVTLHFGHTVNNNWTQDFTREVSLPLGKEITVTLNVKLCPHYQNQGAYAHGSTNACNGGNINAYGTSEEYVERTFTFTMPVDNGSIQTYDYYIKTRCDDPKWDPVFVSAAASVSGTASSGRTMRMLRSALRSAPDGYADVAAVYNRPVTLPALTPEQDAVEKFVIDGNWVMTVNMTKTGFTATIVVTDEDDNETTYTYTYSPTDDNTADSYATGNNYWDAILKHVQIPDEDENGNIYYYYISGVSETDVPKGMTPSFDLDPVSGRTLMTSKDDENVLSVTNQIIRTGSLIITKEVTVNGSPVDNTETASPADGTYTFRLTRKNDSSFAERTIPIAITNGVTASCPAITDLEAGVYIVTEDSAVTPANGAELTMIDGQPAASYSGEVTVPAGGTGTITFTNNVGRTDITVKKVDAEKAAGAAGRYLDQAKFSLYDSSGHILSGVSSIQITDLETGAVITPDQENKFTVPVTGIRISGLPDGSYQLVEREAPDGYIITENVTTFTVSQGTVTQWSLTGTAGPAFEIPNTPGAELPHTGGPGTRLYLLLGGALIAIAGALLSRRHYMS
ncbi:MAG: hypothetical protein E7239_01200 [Sarcina sp.]|nr:hypothetical protein [Sarcina sp.]